MYRGKVMIVAAAVFALGVAFAAQPTSVRADRGSDRLPERNLWVPGTNGVMAVYDSSSFESAPPPR